MIYVWFAKIVLKFTKIAIIMTAEILYTGGLSTTARHLNSGKLIETDAPLDNNGKGEKFSPTDLVAAALASCMLTIMGIEAEGRWPIEGSKITVEKIMVSQPRRRSELKINVQIVDHVLTPTSKEILEEATLRACS